MYKVVQKIKQHKWKKQTKMRQGLHIHMRNILLNSWHLMTEAANMWHTKLKRLLKELKEIKSDDGPTFSF